LSIGFVIELSSTALADLEKTLAASQERLNKMALLAWKMMDQFSTMAANSSMNSKQRKELVGRLSAMAEEIANPLTAVSVRLHTARSALKDSPERQMWVAIEQDIQRIQRILRQLLADFHTLLSIDAVPRKPRAHVRTKD
jgi:signal transduction histidine kinase